MIFLQTKFLKFGLKNSVLAVKMPEDPQQPKNRVPVGDRKFINPLVLIYLIVFLFVI